MKSLSTYLLPIFIFLVAGFSLHAQRIAVSGEKFMVGEEEIWINGANTPWIAWNDFGGAFDYNAWDSEFEKLANAKVNCTRVWITCNSDGAIQIDNNGKILGVTDAFWNDVDDLFEIATKHNIYLIAALTSFDHLRAGGKTEQWRKMYNSDENRQSFIDHYAVPFIDRYKDNPYFFAIEPANEIEWLFDNTNIALDYKNVQNLVAKVANAVHGRSEVLITQGSGPGPKYHSANHGGFDVWSDAALSSSEAGAYLDFFNYHHYSWMTPFWNSPLSRTPESYSMGSKPAIVGEIAANGRKVDNDLNYSDEEVYRLAFEQDWQGVMAWTSNGVDDNGTINNLQEGTQWIHSNYPELVYPSASVSTQQVAAINLKIYPNPTQEVVQWSGGEIAIAQVALIDSKGRTLLQLKHPSQTSLTLPQNLPKGTYYLLFSDHQQVIARKQIILH
jgi:hypothetical protein